MLRRKKRRVKSVRKVLEEKLEKIQRLAVIRRDGGCVLRGVIEHPCCEVLQADHLISRARKSVFFDLRNLNCVCRNMNMAKRYDERILFALEKITNETHGDGTVEHLTELSRKPYSLTIFDLEQLIVDYDRAYRETERTI